MVLKRPLALILVIVAGVLAAAGARADFADGTAAYEAGNFAGAFQAWLPLAEAGNPDAQLAIGILYENGRGVARNYREAVAWYTKSAEAGHPGAQFNLANMYKQGIGVPEDAARAVLWWTLAAEKGLPGAMMNLGVAYHLGEGVDADPVRAFELFLGAAEAGIPAAQFSAGYAYELGLGTEPNLDEARRLYALAASSGMQRAAERLAVLDAPATEPEPAVEADEVDVAEVVPAEDIVAAAELDSGGWPFIQLAAFLTPDRAEAAWRDLSARYPDLIGDLPYRVRKMVLSSDPGTVYGLQVGPLPDRAEAKAVCDALRSRSAECFLVGQ